MTQEANAEKKPSVFTEWAGVTTAHGFLDFSSSKTIVGKLIWFFLIFVSLALMCFQLQRSISDFAAHEWKTSIQEKQPEHSGLPLPSIVACNVNRLKYSKVKEYNMTLDMVEYLFMNTLPFNTYLLPSFNRSVEQEFSRWKKLHNFTTIGSIYKTMGHGLEDMFPAGTMTHQFFSEAYSTEYGVCVRVDFAINSTKVGSKGGSLLIFDTRGWDYLPIVANNYILEGIVFQVTYGGAEVGKWSLMYPGMHVAVGIQAVQETVRENEASIINPFAFFKAEPPCERTPKLQFMELNNYTVTNCEMECLWLTSIHFCNCTPFMPTQEYRECEIEEYLPCFGYNDPSFDNITGEAIPFIPEELQNAISQCEKSCPTPCYENYAELAISSTKFPSDAQDHALRVALEQFGNKDGRTNDTIVLQIYFNTLAVKSVELYEATSFNDLVSNCGGLIGLWAGMSFLTVFQAIAYFIKFIGERHTARRSTKVSY